MGHFTPVVDWCVLVYAWEHQGREGWSGITDPCLGLRRSAMCSELSHRFLIRVQTSHSAPLFPSSLVKCGIIIFSFQASAKAPMEGGMTIPGTTGAGVSGTTGVFALYICNNKSTYICDSLRRRKSFKQVGSRCQRGPTFQNIVC